MLHNYIGAQGQANILAYAPASVVVRARGVTLSVNLLDTWLID